MDFLKAEQLGAAKWKVLAIPFGGPLKGGKDLDGEYFSERTDVKAGWFREHPVLFQHGKDSLIRDEDVGIEDELVKGKDGWWGNLWLDRQGRYFDKLNALIRAGKAYGSSGTMPHLAKIDPSGEIRVWPHVEQTITLVPINIFSRITAAKALDHFNSAGIELDPHVKAELTELDSEQELGSELPLGGDDPAMARLAATLDNLEATLRRFT